jgi:hypothetical protein
MYLQYSVDLSHEGHPDIDGCLRHGAAELEHRQHHQQHGVEHSAYLEIIWNIVVAISWGSKEGGIIGGR